MSAHPQSFSLAILVLLLTALSAQLGCGSGAPTTPISASVTSLSFPATIVGNASPASVIAISPYRNPTSLRLSDKANFTMSGPSTCSIGAANCQWSVTFVPSIAGTIHATAAITDNVTGSATTVALTGSGLPHYLPPVLSTSALNFGSIKVGQTSAPQTIIATAQNQDALISHLATNGDFQIIQGSSCSAGMPTCAIAVSYAPSTAGPATNSLIVTDTLSGLTAGVALTASGLPRDQPPAPSTFTLNFGSIKIGKTSGPQTVIVTAQYQDALSSQLSPAGDFQIAQGASCIAGSTTCSISISYAPSTLGVATSSLVISDTVNGLATTVTATGSGLPRDLPPTASTPSLNFGTLEIGFTSPPQTIIATAQNLDALVSQFSTTGDFQISQGASCPAGAVNCPITLMYAPSTAGPASNSLIITDTANGLTTTVNLSASGYGNPGPMAGLAYYLPFTDGRGLTITDVSGNHNDASISGSGTPSRWTPTGLIPNAQIATLPNVAALPTFAICAYFPAATAQAFTTYNYVLSLAVAGVNGHNFGTSYGIGTDHGFDAFFPEIGRSNGDPSTESSIGITGNHCVEAVIGSTPDAVPDHLFVDGKEVSYLSHGFTDDTLGGGQNTNSFTFIDHNGGAMFASQIQIFSAWGSSLRDSAGQAMARSVFEINRLSQAGVQFGLPTSTATDSSCSITGTSIEQGFQGSHPISALLNLDFPCTIHDFAVSGQAPKDMAAGFQDREGGVYHVLAPRNIAYNGGPTNGVVNYQESPANAFQDVLDWNTQAHAQGWKTIATTMISRCLNNGYQAESGDALKQQFNALLLANAAQFDWVANYAAAPEVGADDACSNRTFFADAAHPTDAGQAFLVAAARAGFEGVYRTAATSITSAYTQVPSDSIIIAGGAGGYAVTLMDAATANFNPNAPTCVRNTAPASIALQAFSGQTIGGLTTPKVPSGNTVCFLPAVLDPGKAGAVWQLLP